MAASQDWPRLGDAAVDPARLAEPGISWSALADELGIPSDAPDDPAVPIHGWRVLTVHDGGAVLVGAPIGSTGRWWLGQAQPDRTDAGVQLHSAVAVRRSRSDARRGLTLRWPRVTPALDLDDVVIDVVNTGDERWMPDGDTFHAVGIPVLPGTTDFAFGWASMGRAPAVPLDPGEYARVRVDVNAGVWTSLEPGAYDLQVVLVGLDLRVEDPLRITVTAEQIARHRASRPGRDPRSERRMLDAELARIHATLTAAPSLPVLAEIVATAGDDTEAVQRIAALLPCDAATAAVVLGSPLRDFGRDGRAMLSTHGERLAQRRAAIAPEVSRAE